MEKKKKKKSGNSQYITTTRELKNFTKQVEEDEFQDKKFKKAYDFFRTPAYGQQKESVENGGCKVDQNHN